MIVGSAGQLPGLIKKSTRKEFFLNEFFLIDSKHIQKKDWPANT